ncbi:Arrestin- trafficking adapter 3 [Turnera subulata]|uniref:Arrestin- trafficking adapter 3 n=1 Tax=Turnera subulata TaxID=218843 RepID=A0A9Q0GGM0_9ROSI|nr:Arrestin- trafficking adapter 3 [Turnera subulata]
MTDALDMSLDDLIKSNRKSNSRGRGGGGGGRPPRSSGPGPARRFPNRGGNRAGPYSKPVQAPDTTWQHDMFMETAAAAAAYPARAGRPSSIETGTKLYISNLDYGVSNEDIKELFSEVGDLKRYSIHYDRSGRSEGTAEVVFARREDAVAAVKRYNNVQLDGKPMKIEIVGTNITSRPAVPPPADGIFRNPNGPPRSQGRGSAIGRLRGGGAGGGFGRGARRGRGRGRGRGEKVSAEDLDADLEKYHSEAMQEN